MYDEVSRGRFYPLDYNREGQKAFLHGEWNKARVEAIGDHLRTWVNDIPCADLVDNTASSGFIALQVPTATSWISM